MLYAETRELTRQGYCWACWKYCSFRMQEESAILSPAVKPKAQHTYSVDSTLYWDFSSNFMFAPSILGRQYVELYHKCTRQRKSAGLVTIFCKFINSKRFLNEMCWAHSRMKNSKPFLNYFDAFMRGIYYLIVESESCHWKSNIYLALIRAWRQVLHWWYSIKWIARTCWISSSLDTNHKATPLTRQFYHLKLLLGHLVHTIILIPMGFKKLKVLCSWIFWAWYTLQFTLDEQKV